MPDGKANQNISLDQKRINKKASRFAGGFFIACRLILLWFSESFTFTFVQVNFT
jgi:hypothetical protein